jgi:hypothetical protein
MNATLLKALILLVPVSILFAWSLSLFLRGKTVFTFLQVIGSGCLVVVLLAHICEALHLFSFMHWGSPHSAGHYLDISSVILGLALFPVGYLSYMLTKRYTNNV